MNPPKKLIEQTLYTILGVSIARGMMVRTNIWYLLVPMMMLMFYYVGQLWWLMWQWSREDREIHREDREIRRAWENIRSRYVAKHRGTESSGPC